MKASTVFILALALLVGLGVAAGAKSAGLFDKKPEPIVEKPVPSKVLVAKVPLFEDLATTPAQVAVRELKPEEESRLAERLGKNWKEKVMPAVTGAVNLRVARRNIPADSILMKDDFAETNLPERLTALLEPNTRAVNVTPSKDKAAGGVLRVGEYVDVMLTTKIGLGNQEETRTACISRGCKVIMKRNMIWTMAMADPDDKPLHFTLQANAYRAALIEYAQGYGQVSLFPVAPPQKTPGTFSDPASKEYANEDQRVDEVVRGVRTIGSEDLIRIFQVTAPPPKPVAPPPWRIQHLGGTQDIGMTVLPGAGVAAPASAPAAAPAPAPVQPAGGTGAGSGTSSSTRPAGGAGADSSAGLTFRLPSATGSGECKTCGKGKEPQYQTLRPTN